MSNVLLESPDLLTHIWRAWLAEFHKPVRPTANDMFYRQVPFHRISRRDPTCQRFENWLFHNGAEVRQIDGERYLHFFAEDRATLFLLRWL